LNNSIKVPVAGNWDFEESEFSDIRDGITNSWIYYNLIYSWGYIRRNHRNTLQTNGDFIWSYKNPIAVRIDDTIYINDLTARSNNFVSYTTSCHISKLVNLLKDVFANMNANNTPNQRFATNFKLLHPYEFAALVQPCSRPFDPEL
jgi:hypothetical protein